jgi:D-glycero-alpha-D-manno-heptose-7-phosphate kinase
MRIDASAPTRLDLAGGTIDIWPLYLHHENAQTINVAISLRARCTLAPEPHGRVAIWSEDAGATVTAPTPDLLPVRGPLALLARLVRFFGARGVRVATGSASPVGAGIGGSSALTIAVAAALAAWTRTALDPEALMLVAQNVEAQAIGVPTGVQDYRPAVYGGVSAVELGVDGVRRVALPVDLAALDARLVVAYTGASRHSGLNNWEIFKRHLDGDAEIRAAFDRIAAIARALRAALVAGDWAEVARQVAAEWEVRRTLAPGVSTPHIDALIAAARAAGAQAAKVCGAGGGGCLVCLAEPAAQPAVRAALAAGGAQLLECHVEPQGLTVTVSDEPAR